MLGEQKNDQEHRLFVRMIELACRGRLGESLSCKRGPKAEGGPRSRRSQRWEGTSTQQYYKPRHLEMSLYSDSRRNYQLAALLHWTQQGTSG